MFGCRFFASDKRSFGVVVYMFYRRAVFAFKLKETQAFFEALGVTVTTQVLRQNEFTLKHKAHSNSTNCNRKTPTMPLSQGIGWHTGTGPNKG